MKTLVTLALLSIATTAPIRATATTAPDTIELCATMGRLGASIMEQRQNGIPMSTLMTRAVETTTHMTPFITGLIQLAYEEPLWRSDGARADAILEFSDDVERGCFGSRMARQ